MKINLSLVLIMNFSFFRRACSLFKKRNGSAPLQCISSSSRPSSPAEYHRLERILASRGLGSRKEVASIIRQGRVSIAGNVVKSGKTKFPSTCVLEVDGQEVHPPPLLAVYHKPVGVLCSVGDPWGRENLENLPNEWPILRSMHPVGRLDFDTSGLLLYSR